MIKLASWNVNGLRACAQKGFLDWVDEYNFDVICLQETKAQVDQLDESLLRPLGYESFFSSAEKKGYSGVATYIHHSLECEQVWNGLGIEKFDREGRTLIHLFSDFILFNCYFPNGQRDHGRVPYKLEYCQAVNEKRKQLCEKFQRPSIVTGDFNTAHHPIDLANPKGNVKTTGFLPHERAWLDKFEQDQMVDIFRKKHPEENGHYTWWTYRQNCRERNIGWRIDYFWVDERMQELVSGAEIQSSVLGSDHCPITLELH